MKLAIYLKLAGFTLFTGVTFQLAAFAVRYMPAPAAAAWRFGLAAALMLAIVGFKEHFHFQALRKNAALYIVLGLVGVFGFNMSFFLGMKHTSPINASLIMATNPLLSTLLARIVLKNAITMRQVAGMIVSLLGVLFVITQGSFEFIRELTFSPGDFLILMGNLCWALYGVLGRRYIRSSGQLAATAYSMTVGALLLFGIVPFTAQPVSLPDIPYEAWGAIAFMAVFTSVLGYLWWNQGITELGVGRTAVFFNLVPVVTMALSFLMGKQVSFVQVLGTVLVMLGVVIATGAIKLKLRGESLRGFRWKPVSRAE